jgi:hypothetical protein
MAQMETPSHQWSGAESAPEAGGDDADARMTERFRDFDAA